MHANSTQTTAFPLKSRPRADSGSFFPHAGIKCRDCGRWAWEAWSSSPNVRHIGQKFEAAGWDVGRNRAQDRCPMCRKDARNRQLAYLHAVGSQPKVAKEKSLNATVPKAEPPAAITMADRRAIKNHLDSVYVEDQGYIANHTDASVAAHLNMPLAWIREIREEWFGPEKNEAQDKLVARANEIREEMAKDEERMLTILASYDLRKKELERLLEKVKAA